MPIRNYENHFSHLRPAKEDDCPRIHKIHRYAVRHLCRQHYDDTVLNAWLGMLSEEMYLANMRDAHKRFWVLEYNYALEGFFQVDIHRGELDALYVNPILCRRGLGTTMLYRAECIVAGANLSLLRLYASLNSVGFYSINGYSRGGPASLPLNQEVQAACELMYKSLNHVF